MKDRYRLFEVIIYKDSESYDSNEVLKLCKGYKYYSYILHDKDVSSDGNLKKSHYHIIIKLDNATSKSALSKKLGVPENFISNIRNERSYVRYLIHFDDDDKYQYDFSEIKVSRNYERYVSKCFDDKESEQEIIHNIYAFITNLVNQSVTFDYALFLLIEYVNSNCYDTIYKRYRFEFQNTLKMLYK